MRKLSQRHLLKKKLSKRSGVDEEKIVQEMREKVKKDPKVVEKFQQYRIPLDDIDNVHIEFCDLDVSAKTKNKKIYLNRKMLDKDSPIKDPTHYLVHEIIHYLQQKTGTNISEPKTDDYLGKPTEQEAFEAQVDYKKREESPQEAKRYVKQLLDYHDVEGDERKETAKELYYD